MQDPEAFLNALDIGVPGAVDGSLPAAIDNEHKRYINWEVFFFADTSLRDRFDDDPLRYCGLVTDPVIKVRFAPDEGSPSYDYGGRTYFFTTDSTRSVFESMPDSLANPNPKMMPKKSQKEEL